MGWPSATAPPFTFTLAPSMPSSRMTATACTANASFSSKRSTSCRFQPAFFATLRDASTGVISSIFGSRPLVAWATMRASGVRPSACGARGRHHDQRGGAVVHRRRVAGGDAAVLLEGRLQRAQRLAASCRRAPTRRASNSTGSPFFCGIAHRQDLGGELAGGVRGGGLLVAVGGEGVLLVARHLVRVGHGLAGVAHVPVLERAPQAVVDHRSRSSARGPCAGPRGPWTAGTARCSSTPCRRPPRSRCRRSGCPAAPASPP